MGRQAKAASGGFRRADTDTAEGGVGDGWFSLLKNMAVPVGGVRSFKSYASEALVSGPEQR